MSKSFKLRPEQFTDKYYQYPGTDSIEEMLENINRLNLEKSKCYFIKLNEQIYAVFFETFEKEIIVGGEKVFYNTNGRLVEKNIGDAKIGYSIKGRNVKNITDTIAREMLFIYPTVEFYEFPNSKSKEYRLVENDLKLSNYMVILGLTFIKKFYNPAVNTDISEMSMYLNTRRN